MRTPVLLGVISIALFIVYAVLINYVFVPVVVKPWGYCIFGACVSLTTSMVAWMGTFPVYVNVPLIGTDLILARLHGDRVAAALACASARGYKQGLIALGIFMAAIGTVLFAIGLVLGAPGLVVYSLAPLLIGITLALEEAITNKNKDRGDVSCSNAH